MARHCTYTQSCLSHKRNGQIAIYTCKYVFVMCWNTCMCEYRRMRISFSTGIHVVQAPVNYKYRVWGMPLSHDHVSVQVFCNFFFSVPTSGYGLNGDRDKSCVPLQEEFLSNFSTSFRSIILSSTASTWGSFPCSIIPFHEEEEEEEEASMCFFSPKQWPTHLQENKTGTPKPEHL